MSSNESIQSVPDGISNGDAPHRIEKNIWNHLYFALFAIESIVIEYPMYIYAYRHRVVIQVCNII